jgi:hypothetical protein
MRARSSKGSSLRGNIFRRLWRDIGWRWYKVLALLLFSLLARHLWIVQITCNIALEYLLYLSDRFLGLKGVTRVGKLELRFVCEYSIYRRTHGTCKADGQGCCFPERDQGGLHYGLLYFTQTQSLRL